MALNPNVWRVTSEADIATTNDPYVQQKASADRITVVPDPTGQRGNVVKLFRNTGDAEVSSGKRVELARDQFSSEYAFKTGGGWYYTSYMLGTGWKDAIANGALPYNSPPGDSLSALIKQFHPRNVDGFIHPIWCIRVSDRGVTLNKNATDDSETVIEPKATWEVDEMVWHDVVFGIVWNGDKAGKFMCYLDGQLMYTEVGPQIYPGASAGCWYSEGIYLPGGERDVDSLTIYTQGYAQGYPGTSYSAVVGQPPISNRPIR